VRFRCYVRQCYASDVHPFNSLFHFFFLPFSTSSIPSRPCYPIGPWRFALSFIYLSFPPPSMCSSDRFVVIILRAVCVNITTLLHFPIVCVYSFLMCTHSLLSLSFSLARFFFFILSLSLFDQWEAADALLDSIFSLNFQLSIIH
jgi:hypothetical protein